jgi:hypothetical protein
MQYVVAVAKLKPAKGHSHPRLDVGRKKHQRTVFYNHLKVGVKIFKHEVEVLLVRKDIQEL